jgi:hypothetical protein
MERSLSLVGVLATTGLAVMLVIAVTSARALDQPVDKVDQMMSPQMESGKTLTKPQTLDRREGPTKGELSKEMEQPIQVPETNPSKDSHPGYRPLCGPSKDAINHYACGDGYNSY